MRPIDLCRLLITGPVGTESVPDLADDETRAEVRGLLQAVGCDLAYSETADAWMARLTGPLPQVDDHNPVFSLHAAELAVLAACWLHLRFLADERARLDLAEDTEFVPDDDEAPSIDVEDLVSQFHGKLNRSYVESMILGRLKNLGFLRQRAGRLYAGPLLDTVDPVPAAQQARMFIARHQRLSYLERRAIELLDESEGEVDAEAP